MNAPSLFRLPRRTPKPKPRGKHAAATLFPLPPGRHGFGYGAWLPDSHAETAEAEPQEPCPAPAAAPEDPVATEALAPLRARLTEAFPEPPAPPTADILRKTLDGLRNLPEPPSAYLLTIAPDGTRLRYPLGRGPVFAGPAVTRDDRPAAGMYVGTNAGRLVIYEATSPEVVQDAITALTAMLDVLVNGAADVAEAAREMTA